MGRSMESSSGREVAPRLSLRMARLNSDGGTRRATPRGERRARRASYPGARNTGYQTLAGTAEPDLSECLHRVGLGDTLRERRMSALARSAIESRLAASGQTMLPGAFPERSHLRPLASLEQTPTGHTFYSRVPLLSAVPALSKGRPPGRITADNLENRPGSTLEALEAQSLG